LQGDQKSNLPSSQRPGRCGSFSRSLVQIKLFLSVDCSRIRHQFRSIGRTIVTDELAIGTDCGIAEVSICKVGISQIDFSHGSIHQVGTSQISTSEVTTTY
jgi:hypothetical protein